MAPAALSYKLNAVSDLIRLPKQQGTLLLLWPTMWSLFLASGGRPSARLLAIFVLGTFIMRSAGCVINDIADRNFDPHVERTRQRPLANGRLKVGEALMVLAALGALALLLVVQLNTLTIMLSAVAAALAAVYPFVKRYSNFPQIVLGMAFGWGAVMAWSAVQGALALVPFLVFGANVLWSTAYDTIYALMDKEDDLRIGVKSTAIYFGPSVYGVLAALYVGMAGLLAAAGLLSGLGAIFLAGLLASLALFLAMVARVKAEPTARGAFRAFMANAFIGGLILASVVLDQNL